MSETFPEKIVYKEPAINTVEPLAPEVLPLPDRISSAANLNDDDPEIYKRSELTAESLAKYYHDRAVENFNLLQGKSPTIAKYYREVITTSPHIRIIGMVDERINQNANFSCLRRFVDNEDGKSKFRPDVHYNLSHMETYTEPGTEFLLRQIAILVGAKDEAILNNNKLVSTFVFLHELGHGKDYLENYLLPEKGSTIRQAVIKAATLDTKQRARDLMTQPIPRARKQGETMKDVINLFKSRLTAMDIHNSTELDYAIQRGYREMSSERYADSFAEKFIMDHYDDFFLRPGEKDDGSGRIVTGEMIKMGDDFADILGLRSGTNISLEKVSKNGDSGVELGYSQTGFIKRKLEINKSIFLGDGDISHDPSMNTTSIKEIYRQKDKNGQNFISALTNSGSVYKIKINNAKPPFITVDAENLSSTLDLNTGSKIQLLKRAIHQNGDSTLDEGAILSGTLKNPIVIGKHILLDNGSETTTVMSIRRRWRSFFVETSSGSI